MDKKWNQQTANFLSADSKPKGIAPIKNECKQQITNNQSKALQAHTFTSTKDKGFDDAMQELLNKIYELENAKGLKSTNRRDDNGLSTVKDIPSKDTTIIEQHTTTKCDTMSTNHFSSDNNLERLAKPISLATHDQLSGSIERLQQKQSEVQRQLDKHLEVAKQLSDKETRKVKSNGNLEENNSKSFMIGENEGEHAEEQDDDDELAEFEQVEMQIDNELRISELNRQLDDIQEELRLKLFNQLLSNMNRSGKARESELESARRKHDRQDSAIGNQSASSSSCSTDQPTTSSSTSTGISRYNLQPSTTPSECNKVSDVTDRSNNEEDEQNIYSEPISDSQQTYDGTINANGEFVTNYKVEKNSYSPDNHSNTPTNVHSDLDSTVENINGFVALTPTTSKESIGSSNKKSPPNELNTICNDTRPVNGHSVAPDSFTSTTQYSNLNSYSSSHRNSSTICDLARIEEDEEDCQEYCNSNRFRTVYKEKFSPLIDSSPEGGIYSARCHPQLSHPENHMSLSEQIEEEGDCMTNIQLNQEAFKPHSSNLPTGRAVDISNCSSFNEAGSSGRRIGGNVKNSSIRPLTIYLPKPDEEIDLVEHIQALGHDIDIISADLKISPTNAQGYLWKCCSNNNRKWLKRYFYFDRYSKTLSYYESEENLVKKHNAPKNCIAFSEISDVYVDHKLSGIGQKERSSKRKNYVFVLATVARNYLLASSKAESMRAWIDVLFTAAKANDYFQQLAAIESDDDELSR